MKKYMEAENIEVLKDFNFSKIDIVINNRCNRVVCAKCNTVSERWENECSCKKDENSRNGSFSVHDGKTVLFRDSEHLHFDVDSDGPFIFYYQLVVEINQSMGTMKFSKSPVPILKINGDECNICSNIDSNKIKISDVLEVMKANGICCSKFEKLANLCDICEMRTIAMLYKYGNLIDAGHTLFADEEFVKTHKRLISNVYNRNYSEINIVDIPSMCEHFEIPECLADSLNDDNFENMTGYSDIRMLDKHPIEIKGCFTYYVTSGKFTRKFIKSYLDTFQPEFWTSRDLINTFLTYVRKNMWMGQSVFANAMESFAYAKSKGFQINENTINSRFYFGMKNVDAFAENFGGAEADEFCHIRDSQGIIAALKQLIVWEEAKNAK